MLHDKAASNTILRQLAVETWHERFSGLLEHIQPSCINSLKAQSRSSVQYCSDNQVQLNNKNSAVKGLAPPL